MTFKSKARRAGWLLVVAAFAFGLFSAVKPQQTSAYGLLSSRNIRMSSSAGGATNTAYQVGFTTVTNNQTVGSVVIKFCSNSPIIGETNCNIPTGFNVNRSTLTVSSNTGNLTGLTVSTAAIADNLLVLTRTPSAVANGAVTFTLGNGSTNGITNPTATNTTYYARILLFPTSSPTLTAVAESTASDAGGVALSTATALNVTAKVQETLVFCVWTTTNCAGGGNAIALGNSEGVLQDTTTTYTSTANFDLASNALGGVMVRLKGDTLTSGAFTISPHGTTCTADLTTTSSEQFGIRVSAYGANQEDPGAGEYECSGGNHMFDVASTNTTYGDEIVRTLGATDLSTSTLELAAKAAGTTEAGIYTTTLQLIANATY